MSQGMNAHNIEYANGIIKNCFIEVPNPDGPKLYHVMHDGSKYTATLTTNEILNASINSQSSSNSTNTNIDAGKPSIITGDFVQTFGQGIPLSNS